MKKTNVYSEQEVRQLLYDAQGTSIQKKFAKEIGISEQYLCDVLKGRRHPGPAILNYLKLEIAYCPYWDKD